MFENTKKIEDLEYKAKQLQKQITAICDCLGIYNMPTLGVINSFIQSTVINNLHKNDIEHKKRIDALAELAGVKERREEFTLGNGFIEYVPIKKCKTCGQDIKK